jgi:hypothetical protein
MPEKCVTCGLQFRTSNELDWHVRNEHMRRTMRLPRTVGEPEPGATGEREPGPIAEEPAGRPWWLRAARRVFGRRPPESPSVQGRGKA